MADGGLSMHRASVLTRPADNNKSQLRVLSGWHVMITSDLIAMATISQMATSLLLAFSAAWWPSITMATALSCL